MNCAPPAPTKFLTCGTSQCDLIENRVFPQGIELKWGQEGGFQLDRTGILVKWGNLDSDTQSEKTQEEGGHLQS